MTNNVFKLCNWTFVDLNFFKISISSGLFSYFQDCMFWFGGGGVKKPPNSKDNFSTGKQCVLLLPIFFCLEVLEIAQIAHSEPRTAT